MYLVPDKEFTFVFYKNEEKVIEKKYKKLETDHTKFSFCLFDYKTGIDLKKKLFTRENEDFLFTLDLEKKSCQIYLKKENLTLPVQVDYCDIYEENNRITIEYSIETDDVKVKMEIIM